MQLFLQEQRLLNKEMMVESQIEVEEIEEIEEVAKEETGKTEIIEERKDKEYFILNKI
jgi:citrate lyase alpha subunit